MKYLSVFSGIEAASVAWKDLGWEAAGFADINPFASALLAHHYPHIKNYGDITQHPTWDIQPGSIDLLIGGSPCQAFSIGGYREGLADPRGNLTLTFVSLIDRLRPAWVIWENVPGVLSSNRGADFAAFLWALGQCGYGFSWRVLDAKGTGSPYPLPQRRRRVYLVAVASGKCEDPAQILFKPEGLPGDIEKGSWQGQNIATTSFEGFAAPGQSNHLKSEAVYYENNREDGRIKECHLVAPTLLARYGTGGGNAPLIRQVITFQPGNLCRAAGANPSSKFVTTLKASMGDQTPCVAEYECVRRLHPIEAERLQGFPDNYTQIPWKGKHPDKCPDNLRMIALGNSMAVPVVRLLGERIKAYEEAKAKR